MTNTVSVKGGSATNKCMNIYILVNINPTKLSIYKLLKCTLFIDMITFLCV